MEAESIQFGQFTLHPGQRRLISEGEAVPIGGRAMDLLILLTSRPGRVIPTSEIISAVWVKAFVDEANLRSQVATLRRALGDNQREPRYILNVPGQGYCFICPVSELGEPSTKPALPAFLSRRPRQQKAVRIFGRDEAIANICLLLEQKRILTIVGPGGIGKSTVAHAVVGRIGHRYADGIVSIDLAPIANPLLVPTVIASALGYVPRSQDPLSEICDYLQGKQLLFLVDSCDHLIDAVAPWIEMVGLETPGVTVLATSREPLRAQSEHVHRLPGLDIPPMDTAQSVAEAMRYPAVELFVERARACLGGYELSEEDVPAVSEICSRLDGIALAIELAAGRLETIGIKGLAVSLGDCFRILTHGRRTALPRHQTLRATLDWSYNILAPDEQAALRDSSIFKGHFTFEGIRQVILAGRSEEEIENAIFGLVAKSLIQAEPNGSTTRYRLLDTTRTYAFEKLVISGYQLMLSLRHATYALALFERAEGEIYARPADSWGEDYGLYLPTLRSALDWAFTSDGDSGLGARLTIAAVPLFFRMSLLDECLTYVSRSIDYLENNPGQDERNRMKLYAALGWPQMLSTGDNGMSAWAAALKIAESIGDIDHQLRAIWAAWVDRLNHAEPQAALVFSDRFRELALLSEDRTDTILSIRLNGATKHWLGCQKEARAAMEEMLKAYVTPPSAHAVRFQFDQTVTARIVLARALWLQGFADQAVAEVHATVDYAIGIDHNLSFSNVLAEAACSIALWTGNEQLAQAYIDLLEKHTKADSLDVWHTYAQCFAGVLASAQHQTEAGLRLIDDGLQHLRASGFILFQTEFLGEKAKAHKDLNDIPSALDAINVALAHCAQTGERWCLAELRRIKGEILLANDPLDTGGLAMLEFRRSLLIAGEDGTLAWELRTATSFARLLEKQARSDEARQLLSSTFERFTEGFQTRDLKDAEELLQSLGESFSRAG